MKALFVVTGQLINVFESPKSTNDEGKEYGGDHKIQILGDVPMSNGESRKDMITLKIQDVGMVKDAIGATVTAPISGFAKGSQITWYIPKGSKIDVKAA
jgi:hypothetical protein